jgi:hypothetical protein
LKTPNTKMPNDTENTPGSDCQKRLTLEVGCVILTNGGKRHTIAEIGFEGDEAVAENCFYRWNKDWPHEIEHAAMHPDRDTILSVTWPNV